MYNDGHGTAYCGLVRYSNHVRFGKAVFVYGWCGKSKQTPRDPRRCQDFCKESMPRHPKFHQRESLLSFEPCLIHPYLIELGTVYIIELLTFSH